MYFDGQFKPLGHFDITGLKKLALSISEEQWDIHGKRQETFKVHSHTKTVPLIFDEDFRHRFPTIHPLFSLFQEYLEPIQKNINQFYQQQTLCFKTTRPNPVTKGYFARIILVKLAAHSEIAAHRDNGFSLSRCHRIHLPICTNNKVQFIIDNKTVSLAEGQLTEINNRGLHSVKNLSDEARIHIILDFVIPSEIVKDPLIGELVA